HRHDGPLLTAAMSQPREQGSPFRAFADQPPGCLHQCPPQQSRAFLGDLHVLGFPLAALPYHRHQSRVGTDRLGALRNRLMSPSSLRTTSAVTEPTCGAVLRISRASASRCGALATKALSFLLTASR